VLTVNVVIAVYRAARTLRELYGQLSVAMGQIAPTFEIIFLEDCGDDESQSAITELIAAGQRLRGIRMSRNYSQQNALLCGIRAARYDRHDVIVTVDDDLQHSASEIAPVPAALGPDVDGVYGAPQNEHHGLMRDVASRLTKLALASAMGLDGKCRLSLHAPSRFAGRSSLRSRQWRSDRYQRLVFSADSSADVGRTSGGESEPRRRRVDAHSDDSRVNELAK
jgi:glycosyltransferase involved in cell wall biosynthesis